MGATIPVDRMQPGDVEDGSAPGTTQPVPRRPGPVGPAGCPRLSGLCVQQRPLSGAARDCRELGPINLDQQAARIATGWCAIVGARRHQASKGKRQGRHSGRESSRLWPRSDGQVPRKRAHPVSMRYGRTCPPCVRTATVKPDFTVQLLLELPPITG